VVVVHPVMQEIPMAAQVVLVDLVVEEMVPLQLLENLLPMAHQILAVVAVEQLEQIQLVQQNQLVEVDLES
jgi:hypothetical protein